MNPIYEQGSGKGIGHGLKSFLRRFDEIFSEHLKNGRAKSFAFIFYDFNDGAIRKILKDQGVFVKLDRLSGNDLSIFYLHARKRESIEAFNTHFFNTLGIKGQASLPCVVFFRFRDGGIIDVEIAQLESADLIHGFSELYGSIQKFLSAEPASSAGPARAIRWLKGGAKFLSIEVFRALITKMIV